MSRVTNVLVGGNNRGGNIDPGFNLGGRGNNSGGIRSQLGQIQGQIQNLLGQLGGNGPNRQGALRQLVQLRNQLQQLQQLSGGNNPIIGRLLNTLNTILARYGVAGAGNGQGAGRAFGGGNGGFGGGNGLGAGRAFGGGNGGFGGGNGLGGFGGPGNGGFGGGNGGGIPGFGGGNGGFGNNGLGGDPFGNGFGNNGFGGGFGNNGLGNDPFGLGSFGNGLNGLNGLGGFNGQNGLGGFPGFGGNNGLTGLGGDTDGNGNVWGDPHFNGANGHAYDIQGDAGSTYNLLTDGTIRVTGTMQAYGGGATTIASIVVDDVAGNSIQVGKGGDLTINGETMQDGTYLDGEVTKAGGTVTINTGGNTVVATDGGGYLNVNFKADDVSSPTGMWGQSLVVKAGEEDLEAGNFLINNGNGGQGDAAVANAAQGAVATGAGNAA